MHKRSFFLAAGLVATVAAGYRSSPTQPLSPLAVERRQDQPVAMGVQGAAESVGEEQSLPEDPSERATRLATNRRYNGGHYDLTVSEDRFIEHYAPRALPAIPTRESKGVFVGSVLGTQPYLSEDRTHVYTEITFRVEEMPKNPAGFARPANGTLVIDRIGGAIRLKSGRVVRDDTDVGIGGRVYVGGRYVVFATEQQKREGLDIVKAYELRNGRVFKLMEDGTPGAVLLSNTPNRGDSLSDEQTFLQTIRQRILNDLGHGSDE